MGVDLWGGVPHTQPFAGSTAVPEADWEAVVLVARADLSAIGCSHAAIACAGGMLPCVLAALLATAAEEHSVDQGVMVTGMQATELFRYTMEPDLPRL